MAIFKNINIIMISFMIFTTIIATTIVINATRVVVAIIN